MAKPRRWWITSIIFALVSILVGFGVATATNGLLALSIEPKQVPATAKIPVGQASEPAPPEIKTISMPGGYKSDPLLVMALTRLQDAVEATTGTRPRVVADGRGLRSRQGRPPRRGLPPFGIRGVWGWTTGNGQRDAGGGHRDPGR